MFQSSKQRTHADEQHICVNCINELKCVYKPDKTQWRFVLQYCQKFKSK